MSISAKSLKAQRCYHEHPHDIVVEIGFEFKCDIYRKIRCKEHNTVGYMKIDPCKMTYEMITAQRFEYYNALYDELVNR